MALVSPQLHPSLFSYESFGIGGSTRDVRLRRPRHWSAVAVAVDVPSPTAGGVSGGIRWGSSAVQGPRSEMEDAVVLRSDGLSGFSFAAVFDGHAGFSSVQFLRDELYKEFKLALQDGLLLTSKNFSAIRAGIAKAFENVDTRLLNWLEQVGKDVDSGATATVMLLGKDVVIISHVGDSSVVVSRTGKAEILTSPHRPYGNNKVSLEEVKRIRAAGGWVRFLDLKLSSQVLAMATLFLKPSYSTVGIACDLSVCYNETANCTCYGISENLYLKFFLPSMFGQRNG